MDVRNPSDKYRHRYIDDIDDLKVLAEHLSLNSLLRKLYPIGPAVEPCELSGKTIILSDICCDVFVVKSDLERFQPAEVSIREV